MASLIPPFVRPSPWMSSMRSIASVPSPSQPSRRSTTGPEVSMNVVNFAVTLSGSVPPTSRATSSSGWVQRHWSSVRISSDPGAQPLVSAWSHGPVAR